MFYGVDGGKGNIWLKHGSLNRRLVI